ncbi:dihydrodipicolinate synthase family protein [soil metagenome]
MVTPFTQDLAPDAERFVKQSCWLLSHDVGLAVFGTTSEGNSLSVDEKIELLDQLASGGVNPARIIAGTGCCALPDSVRLTTHATKLGCAGVLMLPPFYYKGVSDDGLFRSFAEVIERVGDTRLRVYLYNIPPVSQVAITVHLIERLLKAYPGIVAGVKDSSGNWDNTRAYLDSFAQEGFAVFPGSEAFLLQGLRHGAAGCISATANVNPGPMARLFATWQAPDADAHQLQLNQVRGIFAKYPLIPALKAVIADQSGDPAWKRVRPPLEEITDGQTASLMKELKAVDFTCDHG